MYRGKIIGKYKPDDNGEVWVKVRLEKPYRFIREIHGAMEDHTFTKFEIEESELEGLRQSDKVELTDGFLHRYMMGQMRVIYSALFKTSGRRRRKPESTR